MVDFKTTSVFSKNIEAYNSGFRHITNQGSARSSKTFSILQLLYLIAKYSKEQLLISVVSESLPHLRRGAIRDFKQFMVSSNEWNDAKWSKGGLIYSVGKSQIEFFSCDVAGKVHGPSRDILFVNECNRIDYETAQQLIIRTRKCCFYDYNPVCEFWIHNEIITRQDCKYIHSTFLDNPYLDQNIAKELIYAGSRNENFKKVYVLGEIGTVEGTVFNNWEIGEFDESLQHIFGQDFGFSKDPTTLIKVAVDEDKKVIYLHECFYKSGLSTQQIYDLNRQYVKDDCLIVADSAEPRLIDELFNKGLNIRPCEKGQGSVSAGLLGMLNYKLIVTDASKNLHKELRNYIWLDSRSKLVIDDFNHGIDAARYAAKRLITNPFFAL